LFLQAKAARVRGCPPPGAASARVTGEWMSFALVLVIILFTVLTIAAFA
jgi:nitrate reductase NapE component